MKTLKLIITFIIFLILIVNTTSCLVLSQPAHVKHDNGKHKGWYKNSKTTKIIYLDKHDDNDKHKKGKSKKHKK